MHARRGGLRVPDGVIDWATHFYVFKKEEKTTRANEDYKKIRKREGESICPLRV